MEQALALARMSPCPRRRYGSVIVDPTHNVIVSEGWNGSLRGAPGNLCAGNVCEREGVESGTHYELGCIHSETNALYNAARLGRPTFGAWLFVTGCPCVGCARAIVQAGIAKVFTIEKGYAGQTGFDILVKAKVIIQFVELPKTPLAQVSTTMQGTIDRYLQMSKKAPDGWLKWGHEDIARILKDIKADIDLIDKNQGGVGPAIDPGRPVTK